MEAFDKDVYEKKNLPKKSLVTLDNLTQEIPINQDPELVIEEYDSDS